MRWALRSFRVWLTIGAAAGATLLASRDERTGWTVVVGVVTAALAAASIRVAYTDAHPDRAEVKAARRQAEIDAILWRYERDVAARRRAGSEDGT